MNFSNIGGEEVVIPFENLLKLHQDFRQSEGNVGIVHGNVHGNLEVKDENIVHGNLHGDLEVTDESAKVTDENASFPIDSNALIPALGIKRELQRILMRRLEPPQEVHGPEVVTCSTRSFYSKSEQSSENGNSFTTTKAPKIPNDVSCVTTDEPDGESISTMKPHFYVSICFDETEKEIDSSELLPLETCLTYRFRYMLLPHTKVYSNMNCGLFVSANGSGWVVHLGFNRPGEDWYEFDRYLQQKRDCYHVDAIRKIFVDEDGHLIGFQGAGGDVTQVGWKYAMKIYFTYTKFPRYRWDPSKGLLRNPSKGIVIQHPADDYSCEKANHGFGDSEDKAEEVYEVGRYDDFSHFVHYDTRENDERFSYDLYYYLFGSKCKDCGDVRGLCATIWGLMILYEDGVHIIFDPLGECEEFYSSKDDFSDYLSEDFSDNVDDDVGGNPDDNPVENPGDNYDLYREDSGVSELCFRDSFGDLREALDGGVEAIVATQHGYLAIRKRDGAVVRWSYGDTIDQFTLRLPQRGFLEILDYLKGDVQCMCATSNAFAVIRRSDRHLFLLTYPRKYDMIKAIGNDFPTDYATPREAALLEGDIESIYSCESAFLAIRRSDGAVFVWDSYRSGVPLGPHRLRQNEEFQTALKNDVGTVLSRLNSFIVTRKSDGRIFTWTGFLSAIVRDEPLAFLPRMPSYLKTRLRFPSETNGRSDQVIDLRSGSSGSAIAVPEIISNGVGDFLVLFQGRLYTWGASIPLYYDHDDSHHHDNRDDDSEVSIDSENVDEDDPQTVYWRSKYALTGVMKALDGDSRSIHSSGNWFFAIRKSDNALIMWSWSANKPWRIYKTAEVFSQSEPWEPDQVVLQTILRRHERYLLRKNLVGDNNKPASDEGS